MKRSPTSSRPDPADTDPDPLATARELAWRRIDGDRAGVSEDVGRMLEAIARLLFEPGALPRAGHPLFADDTDGRARFRLALGVFPEEYRDQRLLDAARHLVCHSDLPISEVAAAVGFAEPELFTKWVRRRTRVAPTKMRAAARGERQPPAPKASTAPQPAGREPWFSVRNWRRMVLGIAPREWAVALLSYLCEAYPEAFDEPLDD